MSNTRQTEVQDIPRQVRARTQNTPPHVLTCSSLTLAQKVKERNIKNNCRGVPPSWLSLKSTGLLLSGWMSSSLMLGVVYLKKKKL